MPESVSERKKISECLNKIVLAVGGIGMVVYAAACFYLYYMQATHTDGQYFESDLPVHIQMALDGWGYSITAWIYRLLSFLPGKDYTISLFLVIATLLTVVISFFVFHRIFQYGEAASVLGAFAGTFVMPFFIRAIHYQRYIGYQSASIWHNSTYIAMKPLALVSFILYLFIAERYGKDKCTKEAVIFALILMLTTGVKTSYIFVFAPAALIFLMIDAAIGIPWKRVLSMATTVIPSVLVILIQEAVLFGKETGNSIVIDFGYTVYYRAQKPYFTMILSALFPVCIFLFNIIPVLKDTLQDIKERKGKLTHRAFLLSWTMWFFGALELLFLRETGARELDANFSWGYDFCLFLLFLVSICYMYRNWKDKKFLGGIAWVRIGYGVIVTGILCYHVYCGIYFLTELMKGTTFFM